MKIIETNSAPQAIGPYSQAIVSNGMVYCSGQIALDPRTNQLKIQNIEEEVIQIIENIKAVLTAAHSDLSKIVKVSIFMSDMVHYSKINEVYGRYFNEHKPAREAIAVKTLPKNVNVEISVIAETNIL